MIEVKKLSPDRWKEYRDLRLEALQSDPIAFGSSYEEQMQLSEDEWKKRLNNTLFAMFNDEPVGMIVSVCETGIKTKHIANIYGVYVKKEYRSQGIGKKLLENALSTIMEDQGIAKIKLAVNSEQQAAIKLYKKFGFEIVGKLEKELFVDGQYYDELMMERHLR